MNGEGDDPIAVPSGKLLSVNRVSLHYGGWVNSIGSMGQLTSLLCPYDV